MCVIYFDNPYLVIGSMAIAEDYMTKGENLKRQSIMLCGLYPKGNKTPLPTFIVGVGYDKNLQSFLEVKEFYDYNNAFKYYLEMLANAIKESAPLEVTTNERLAQSVLGSATCNNF